IRIRTCFRLIRRYGPTESKKGSTLRPFQTNLYPRFHRVFRATWLARIPPKSRCNSYRTALSVLSTHTLGTYWRFHRSMIGTFARIRLPSASVKPARYSADTFRETCLRDPALRECGRVGPRLFRLLRRLWKDSLTSR